jgi:hypothetical protein
MCKLIEIPLEEIPDKEVVMVFFKETPVILFKEIHEIFVIVAPVIEDGCKRFLQDLYVDPLSVLYAAKPVGCYDPSRAKAFVTEEGSRFDDPDIKEAYMTLYKEWRNSNYA